MKETRPKVRRDLSLNPVRHDGQDIIVVQDPLEIIGETLCLTDIASMLLSLMDGTRSIPEIQAVFTRFGGSQVPPNFVASHFEELDKIGLLENETYRRRKIEIFESYSALTEREASHAYEAYEGDPEALRAWVDVVLDDCQDPEPIRETPPKVLVAPHIDFRVNESVYRAAYRQLRNRAYDRVVLMGTGHSILEGIYCLTRKDFKTPLGTTRNDRGAYEKLMEAADGVASSNDFPHRKEHALEFQLVFLQHLLGSDSFELVPILVGGVQHLYHKAPRLREENSITPFLDALREVIDEQGRNTLVVAGVDFSHIGIRFSHRVSAKDMLEETRNHDRNLIEAFEKGDAASFWRTEVATEGKYNVCGFSTLSTILEAMEPGVGNCLDYGVWDDAPTGSAVTFAALVR
jgi:hypothetical protein